jgi:hypothetical protein
MHTVRPGEPSVATLLHRVVEVAYTRRQPDAPPPRRYVRHAFAAVLARAALRLPFAEARQRWPCDRLRASSKCEREQRPLLGAWLTKRGEQRPKRESGTFPRDYRDEDLGLDRRAHAGLDRQ